jgi:ferredoxin-NADP reductase
LDARGDGFNLALALTREPVRRADDYGRRVDTAMLTELLAKLPEPPKRVFVCGSNPFVEAAADATIAAGVAASLIRTERYGG